jgi:hypothetical protein
MFDKVLFLFLFGAVAAICWNCEIHRSTVILLVILGLAICTCASKEYFYAEGDAGATGAAPAPTVPLTNETLVAAGVIRPSVFNYANKIGVTPEMNPLFAFQK